MLTNFQRKISPSSIQGDQPETSTLNQADSRNKTWAPLEQKSLKTGAEKISKNLGISEQIWIPP